MGELSVRDRAFARLLVATVLRRLGQIDALIADCLNTPLAPRAAIIHDILRLGIAQLLFLRTPPHAAVATSVDLAHARGFLTHKGLVNAVLRRLSVEGGGRVERQDAPRLNTPDWLWRSWSRAYGEECARAIAGAHLKEAPLDLTLRGEDEIVVREAAGDQAADRLAAAAGGRLGDGAAGLCRGRVVDPGRGGGAAGAAVRRDRRDATSSICAPRPAARPRSSPAPARG